MSCRLWPLLSVIFAYSGPELHTLNIGPAINLTLSWLPALTGMDMCVSATSPNFTENHWIAIGFVPSESLRLQNTPIVLGSALTAPALYFSVSSPTTHTISTDAPEAGQIFALSNTNFTVTLPTIKMCFTRPWKSGWDSEINVLQRVTWAVGLMDTENLVPLAHAADILGKPEANRCNANVAIDFHVPRLREIGPGINCKFYWVTHPADLDICVSAASPNFTSQTWLALAFAKRDANSMVGSDVVIGNSAGVNSFFVVSQGRKPFAPTKLSISKTRFSRDLPNITMCFKRPTESGRNWLTNRQKVMWAVGETSEKGDYLVHGTDDEDATGESQLHRSLNIPEIDLKVVNSVLLGPAINCVLSWEKIGVFIDMCLTATSPVFTQNTWIAVGFAPSDTRMMQGADIVLGGQNLPPKVLHSDSLWGYPGGNVTVSITGASFTLALPSVSMCFTMPIKGNLVLGFQQRVIWAVGKLTPAGRILAHWSDAEDPSGKTQLHRSADGPRINFLEDPLAAKDDPVSEYNAAATGAWNYYYLLALSFLLC